MSSTPEDPNLPSGVTLRNILFGHKDVITDVAWSAEGGMIAGASADGSIRIWRTDDESAPIVLEGHQGRINGISWDPRGRDLVSASDDRSLRLWDSETGAFKRSLSGHSQPIKSVLWSPNGNLLSTVDSKLIWVWEATNGRLKGTLFDHDGHLRHLAWSPRGDLFASAAEDRTIRLWDAWSLKVRAVLRGHEGPVNQLAWSPDGRNLASASDDHTLQIWDIKSGECMKTLFDHNQPVRTVTWSPDGALIASMARDRMIRIWRADQYKVIAMIHDETISSHPKLAFHPKSNILAGVGILDRMIRLWELDVDQLFAEKNLALHVTEPAKRVRKARPKPPPASIAPAASTPTDPTPQPVAPPEAKAQPAALPEPAPQPEVAAATSNGAPDLSYRNAKLVLVGGSKTLRSTLFSAFARQQSSDADLCEVAVMSTRKAAEGKELHELYLWQPPGSGADVMIHRAHVEDAALVLVVVDAADSDSPDTGAWFSYLKSLPNTAAVLVTDADDDGELIEMLARQGTKPDAVFSGDPNDEVIRSAFEDKCFELVDWGCGQGEGMVSQQAFEQTLSFLNRERKYPLAHVDDLFRHFRHGPGHELESLDATVFQAILRRAAVAGVVTPLGFGGLYLLRPEWLDAYLDCIAQAVPVAGVIPDSRRPKQQENALIASAMERLINGALLPSEPVGDGMRPLTHVDPLRSRSLMAEREDVILVFKVRTEVYPLFAALLTRLSYLDIFEGLVLWADGALFNHNSGGGCGLSINENHSGDGAISLFFEGAPSTRTQVWFEEYVYAFLVEQAGSDAVSRQKVFLCESCSGVITAKQAVRRREMGLDFINCPVCESRVSLLDRMERLMETKAVTKRRRKPAKREIARDLQSWVGAEKTILALIFTDIVGSTDLGNRLGNEGMRSVRRAHFSQGRSLLKEFDAFEVKTIGDSLMLAFRTAVDALDYALEFFEDTGHDEVRIRIGVHVGPVEVEESDLFGAMVNYCSRVESQAKDAELWISNEAYSHVSQQGAGRHKGIPWQCHDSITLKGFEGTHRLWSLKRSDSEP